MYPDSLSVLQQIFETISTAHAKIFWPFLINNCFVDTIVPHVPVYLFNSFMASNSSVRNGEKAQYIEPPFGIIEVYSNNI